MYNIKKRSEISQIELKIVKYSLQTIEPRDTPDSIQKNQLTPMTYF